MKALTICQPYAHLILLPQSDPRHKRVENRTWETLYHGELLIHAGGSTSWLCCHPLSVRDPAARDRAYDIAVRDMDFGKIVGVANLIHCYLKLQLPELADRGDLLAKALLTHRHTEGPFCWALDNVRRFPEPILYRGAQGLFNVPDSIVAEQLGRAVSVDSVPPRPLCNTGGGVPA